MKDKNKLIIISTLIVMICLLSLYSAYKYYNKTPNKVINNIPNTIMDNNKKDTQDNSIDLSDDISNKAEEEINLGDDCPSSGYRYVYRGNSQVSVGACASVPTKCRSSVPTATENSASEVYIGCKVTNSSGSSCTWSGAKYTKEKCAEESKCVIKSISAPQESVSIGKPLFISVTLENCDGQTVTISHAGSSQSVTASNGTAAATLAAGGKICQRNSVTVTVSGDTKSTTVYVVDEWRPVSYKEVLAGDLQFVQFLADTKGENKVGDCVKQAEGVYVCDVKFIRTCGTSPPTVKTYDFCCMTEYYLGLSTQATYKKYQLKKECPSPYRYLDENISEDKCHPIEVPGYCKSNPVGSENPQNVSVDTCESDKTIEVSSKGQICKNNQESFYTINCTKNVTTKFDYDDDGNKNTVRELYKGQGFGYGILATTTTTCDATFNANAWNTVYDKFIDKMNAISPTLANDCKNDNETAFKNHTSALPISDTSRKTEIQSKVYDLWTTISEIRDIVRSYNKFRPTLDYNENTTLNITYKNEGETNNVTDNYEFDKEITEGKFSFQKGSEASLHDPTFRSNCYGNSIDTINENCRPINYKLTNNGNPRKVRMIPKKVSFDSHTGEVTNKIGNNLDGGNKIYTSYRIAKGTYKTSIKVSGLIANSSVTNDKCDIKIKEQDIEYRPIDVTNPFINSKWEKGINWVNSNYDFTKTISAKTWSEKTLNKVDLPSSRIEEIKRSNEAYRKSNYSPYLGVCDIIKSSSQDYVCRVIK